MQRQRLGCRLAKPRGAPDCQPDLRSWEQGLGQTLPWSSGRNRPYRPIQPPDGETTQVCY